MIRVLLDEHGAYTKDLFIKIDATPSQVFIADTTWLSSFLYPTDINEESWKQEQMLMEKKKDVSLLIHLWISLLSSDEQVCFLPVDMADQSSMALQVTKAKKLFKIGKVTTTDITDGTKQAYFMANQSSITWRIDHERQWAIAPQSILTGLNWSLARLELPIVPLKYE